MGVLKNKIPWNLHQRGQRDSSRHQQKIKQAIKNNLHKIIAEEAIITTDGKRTTKVPVKYLDSYHFKHGYPNDQVGHGEGDVGDVLHSPKSDGKNSGDQPGNQAGADVYDTDVSLDELTEMMLEDLQLPWLTKKQQKEIVVKTATFTDIRKKGILSNWSKRRTIMENIKRNALESNKAYFGNIQEEDMRYRSWEEKIERHSNAVIYLMMDRSGSMDEHKRYLCKATFWWLCRFVEKRYENVEIVFIAHDYEAKVVPEKDFFTLANDGGTRCSSAYELALQDIKASRPADIWNIYCFHFSDGDNGYGDNEKCVKLVKELLERSNMFAYGEVCYEQDTAWREHGLFKDIKGIDHPRVLASVLREKGDVYKTLEAFLKNDLGGQGLKSVTESPAKAV